MPDTKITALTALTAADPANDVLPIVDVSDTTMAASGTTKKISINNVLGCSGTATLASATITGAASAASLTVTGATIPTNGLYLPTTNTLEFAANSLAQYRIAPLGVFSWYDGAGGTRMTLNSTGLGVGGSVLAKISAYLTSTATYNSAAAGDDTDFQISRVNNSTVSGQSSTIALNSSSDNGANVARVYLTCVQESNASYASSFTVKTRTAAGTSAERLRIDSSGNVGIGVTPSARFHSKAGAVTQGGIIETSGANALLSFADAGTSSYTRVQIGSSGNNLAAFINSVQAMTLDASGNLLVGKSSASATTIGFEGRANGTVNSTLASSVDANATYAAYSTGAAAYRFYVGMGGTVYATNTTISAISDARLKENVQDIDVGLGAILALKPRKFDWKEGKGKNIKGDRGFIAQEFEQVFPQLVDEWKDEAPEGEAPYKSVRQDLIPVLVKAIQELTARVEALEA